MGKTSFPDWNCIANLYLTLLTLQGKWLNSNWSAWNMEQMECLSGHPPSFVKKKKNVNVVCSLFHCWTCKIYPVDIWNMLSVWLSLHIIYKTCMLHPQVLHPLLCIYFWMFVSTPNLMKRAITLSWKLILVLRFVYSCLPWQMCAVWENDETVMPVRSSHVFFFCWNVDDFSCVSFLERCLDLLPQNYSLF